MDASPQSFQPHLDELISFGSSDARTEDLLAAKAEYFKLTGEVFEDDKTFEARMAAFLDWYLFDRVSPLTSQTPAAELYLRKQSELGPEAAHPFRSFTETVHGLFEVRKVGKGTVRLRELFSGKDFDVTERRTLAGLEKGDILEARLVPFGGHLLFSAAFTFHPKAAADAIRAEVKRRRKKEPDRPVREMTWECARRALNVERYRQLPVDKLYDFATKPL